MPWATWSFSGWTSYRRFEEIRLIQKVHLADWSQRRPSRMCINPLSWPSARSIPWPLHLIHSKLDFQITYGLPTHCCYVIKANIRKYWGKVCRILRCKDYNAQNLPCTDSTYLDYSPANWWTQAAKQLTYLRYLRNSWDSNLVCT